MVSVPLMAPILAARHRRIKKIHPGGGQFGGDVARGQRLDGAHVDGNQPWVGAVDHAVFTQHDFFHVRGIRDIADDNLHLARQLGRAGIHPRALGDQFGGAFRATGVNR